MRPKICLQIDSAAIISVASLTLWWGGGGITGTRPLAGSLKMNTALEYSTRVVQEGGRRCKKSTLIDLVHLDPSKNTFNEPATSICEQVQKGTHTRICIVHHILRKQERKGWEGVGLNRIVGTRTIAHCAIIPSYWQLAS
jgi:hypothetical protein